MSSDVGMWRVELDRGLFDASYALYGPPEMVVPAGETAKQQANKKRAAANNVGVRYIEGIVDENDEQRGVIRPIVQDALDKVPLSRTVEPAFLHINVNRGAIFSACRTTTTCSRTSRASSTPSSCPTASFSARTPSRSPSRTAGSTSRSRGRPAPPCSRCARSSTRPTRLFRIKSAPQPQQQPRMRARFLDPRCSSKDTRRCDNQARRRRCRAHFSWTWPPPLLLFYIAAPCRSYSDVCVAALSASLAAVNAIPHPATGPSSLSLGKRAILLGKECKSK